MSLRILIVDTIVDGHHLNYVRLIIEALRGEHVDVVFATAEDVRERAEYETYLADLSDSFELVDEFASDRKVLPYSKLWRRMSGDWIMTLVDQYKPDELIVSYGNGITQYLGMQRLIRRLDWSERKMRSHAVILSPRYAYDLKGIKERLRNWLSIKLTKASPWDTIFSIDPLVVKYLEKHEPMLARRVVGTADPVPMDERMERAEARERLGIGEERGALLGIAGLIDARKGVPRLIDAFEKTCADNHGTKLLLAGKHRENVIKHLSEKNEALRERVICLNRYLSDEEFRAFFNAVDVVCVPYPDHVGSASLVLRAAQAGKLVLGTDRHWIGWAIEEYGLGIRCDVMDPEQFSRGIEKVLSYDVVVDEAGARRLSELNSEQAFRETWQRVVLGERVMVEA
ncbi:Glycosyl transferases group 1 [Poriferisphaera corsica]|uniref:Glycosyl transferases group 1 n=1 Tax=Poriferisphaera corsica TaxID=2528020 RepID=A0A517YTQ4_9BACT|nr:glycosyltransferase family 4 protein [Poriferisphaera corsica]QDU33611.1 Glycosyl transferases group 1 [Poriferisphaera corsica]